ncbi:MAG TPA: hypothetical protein VM925_36230, partial [Labilithrix sp.]|nr:hypothetical protein [Labilithrix sp.]
ASGTTTSRSSPSVLRAIVAVVGSAPAMMFVLNWTAKFLVDGLGMPKEAIGNYLILPPLAFDVGALAFGALASSRHSSAAGTTPRGLLVFSMLLCASLALVPLSGSPGFAIALFGASACGCGGIYALVTADMLDRVPMDRTSAASGMMAAGQSLAHVLAGPLVGWTIDRTHSHTTAVVVLGLIVVPTTLAFVAWPGIRDGRSADAEGPLFASDNAGRESRPLT